jgi:hypothetical protein
MKPVVITIIVVFIISFAGAAFVLYDTLIKDTDKKQTATISIAVEEEMISHNDTPAGQPDSSPRANFDRFQEDISPNPITDPTRKKTVFSRLPTISPSPASAQITTVPYQEASQGPLPHTFILTGPDQTKEFEGEEITFTFGGSIQNNERLRFETRIIGLDDFRTNWSTSFGTTRTYRLNFKGTRDIIFQVRSKTSDGRVDSTPASWSLKVIHSQFWGDVTISSVNPGWNDESNLEKVTIRNRSGREINITGWQLSDLTSRTAIPKAVNILQPRSNLNFNEEIILSTYGSATINSQPSPIGFSYHENKCTFRLSSSQTLDSNDEYSNCYFQDRFDNNFLRNNWQVYLNLSRGLWDRKSVMVLRDNSGAAVDVLEYGF